jgi:hypothetical protein
MAANIDTARLEAATHEYEILQSAYNKEVRRHFTSDQHAACYIPLLLGKAIRLEELKGRSFAADEDGDDRKFIEAMKAIELLALIPETPKPPKDKDLPDHGGFPLTRAALWEPIIHASVRGCQGDEVFAKALLKRIRLTSVEQKSLRECLRETLGRATMFEPRLLHTLMRVTKRSEPIVVRAFMHAAASRVHDEALLKFWTE